MITPVYDRKWCEQECKMGEAGFLVPEEYRVEKIFLYHIAELAVECR